MRELFIYYRVRSEHAAAAQAAVRRLHAALRARRPEVNARLLCRTDEDVNAAQTWMETYASETGIDAALQSQIETLAHELLPLIDGPRHTESFSACAS